MLTLPVVDITGTQVGTFEVDENVLGGKVRRRLMHQAVVMYQANLRQGTVKTKSRGEVAGSTKKPFRQKGTGNARAGSRKSPIWRGGGVVFGPRPRDYHYSIPKKARKAALKSALLSKILDNETILLDQLQVEPPKTKKVAEVLRNLKVTRSCLLALEPGNQNAWLAARNIPNLETKPAAEVNAYDLLRRQQLVITKAAMEGLMKSFTGEQAGESTTGESTTGESITGESTNG